MIKIEALFIAIYLFFAGFIYGDEPVKLEFTYDIPSEIYVYESGDKFEFEITVRNTGRPFKGLPISSNAGIEIYCENNGERNVIFRPWNEPYTSTEMLIKKGYSETIKIGFFLPDEIPEGSYSVDILYNGIMNTFENIFEVNGD